MADKIKVAVMGASGRMGQALMKGVLKSHFMELIGATERAGSEWIGRKVGACLGGEYLWILDNKAMIVADTEADTLFAKADAVIDFTSPESSVFHAELAAQAKCVLVIGTTGFNAEQLEKIKMAGNHTRIIRSGNMSVGINLLIQLAKEVMSVLGDKVDVDIVETHHRNKVDKPSGTALMFGDAVREVIEKQKKQRRERLLKNPPNRPKVDIVGEREPDKIEFTSIRAGDVVGEHDVIFSSEGERIVLRHVATDRAIFVKGALEAIEWAIYGNQPAGEYNMEDVLSLLY